MLRVNLKYYISYLHRYKYTIDSLGRVHSITHPSNILIIHDGEMDLKGE